MAASRDSLHRSRVLRCAAHSFYQPWCVWDERKTQVKLDSTREARVCLQPYAYDALEPYIDEATMRLHHTKHHQTYTDKLNDAWAELADLAPHLATLSLTEVLSSRLFHIPDLRLRTQIRNHGGGFVNHNLFWSTMAPPTAAAPVEAGGPAAVLEGGGRTREAIRVQWGDLAAFKADFDRLAASVFGSGWVWLLVQVCRWQGCRCAAADASQDANFPFGRCRQSMATSTSVVTFT
jgi:superoxide dismutase